MTSGCRGTPCFRRYDRGAGFETGDFVKEKLGGGGYRGMTRAHHFSSEVRFRSLRHVLLSPKPDLDKNKPSLSRMKKSHGLGIENMIIKQKCNISDHFGLRSPVLQKTFQAKSASLRLS